MLEMEKTRENLVYWSSSYNELISVFPTSNRHNNWITFFFQYNGHLSLPLPHPDLVCITPFSGNSYLLLLGSHPTSILSQCPDSRAGQKIQVPYMFLYIDLCAFYN